jgi:hypothetical protein
MDRAMLEHIARALVGGLVLSLSPGRFVLVHSSWLHFGPSWRIVVAWCCNRHHKSALAVSSARLTLSGLCRLWRLALIGGECVVGVWSSGTANAPLHLPLRL